MIFPKANVRRLGIAFRTALLSWLVTLVTLLIFLGFIIPQQKQAFLETLRFKAQGISASLRAIGAVTLVNENYSAVAEHCRQLLNKDDSIRYLVVTRDDGFSLVAEAPADSTPETALSSRPNSRWRMDTLDRYWRPARRTEDYGIDVVPLFQARLFHYTTPISDSGIEWGWLHIGLSLRDYDASVKTLYGRTFLLALSYIAFSLMVSLIYASRLVRPILALQTTVQRVARGDYSARADVNSGDEVGNLGRWFNAMIDALLEARETLEQRVRERTRQLEEQVEAKERARNELAETQQRLMELSRQAGMAEVATGVLHNIGNVLNSVNVSATLVANRLQSSRLDRLQASVKLLQEHQQDLNVFLREDPKGQRLIPYLGRLAQYFENEHAVLLREVDALARNVEHIKEIVSVQQNYARISGIAEPLSLAGLIEDAVQVNQAGLDRHGIQIIREYEPLPLIAGDKHKLLQILLNLIRNAQEAIRIAERPAGTIWLRIERQSDDRIRIQVQDTGIGIDPEHLTGIFSHGFTTKRDGHGFGLHLGALAARQMGGSLSAASQGLGHGATFTLELPLQSPAVESENNHE